MADLAQVRKQVEYYLSDANLCHDAFFQKHIKANSEGWLDIEHVLSCPKMKQMKATSQNVLDALKESHLETKLDGEKHFVRRTAPLPDLVPRERDGNNKSKDNKLNTDSAHSGGLVCLVKNVPEEVNWHQVKDAFNDFSNKNNTQAKKPRNVMFANKPNEKNEMILVFNPFENDLEWAKSAEVDVNGAKLRLEILYGDELKAALKVVPPHVALQRSKNSQQKRKKEQPQKMKIGGIVFQSLSDVRSRVKNILQKTQLGQELVSNSVEYAIISSLLDYHPKKDTKLQGMKGIKVDKNAAFGQDSTCFFVVKEDGSAEDFSINKCLEELARRPPLLTAGGHVAPAAAAPAAPESPSSSKRKLEEAAASAPSSPSARAASALPSSANAQSPRKSAQSPVMSPSSKRLKVDEPVAVPSSPKAVAPASSPKAKSPRADAKA